jgi:formylglycine-generating enzyme required for sulfatase activity
MKAAPRLSILVAGCAALLLLGGGVGFWLSRDSSAERTDTEGNQDGSAEITSSETVHESDEASPAAAPRLYAILVDVGKQAYSGALDAIQLGDELKGVTEDGDDLQETLRAVVEAGLHFDPVESRITRFSSLRAATDERIREPAESSVSEELRTVTSLLRRDDVLLFYFSGHGFTSPHAGDFREYLVMYDTRASPDQPPQNGFPVSRLAEIAASADSRGARAIFVMDACRNVISTTRRGGGGGSSTTRMFSPQLARNPLSVWIQSCEPNAYSYTVMLEGTERGYFSYFFTRALQKDAVIADSNNDGRVTAGEAFDFARKQMGLANLKSQVPFVSDLELARGVVLAAHSASASRRHGIDGAIPAGTLAAQALLEGRDVGARPIDIVMSRRPDASQRTTLSFLVEGTDGKTEPPVAVVAVTWKGIPLSSRFVDVYTDSISFVPPEAGAGTLEIVLARSDNQFSRPVRVNVRGSHKPLPQIQTVRPRDPIISQGRETVLLVQLADPIHGRSVIDPGKPPAHLDGSGVRLAWALKGSRGRPIAGEGDMGTLLRIPGSALLGSTLNLEVGLVPEGDEDFIPESIYTLPNPLPVRSNQAPVVQLASRVEESGRRVAGGQLRLSLPIFDMDGTIESVAYSILPRYPSREPRASDWVATVPESRGQDRLSFPLLIPRALAGSATLWVRATDDGGRETIELAEFPIADRLDFLPALTIYPPPTLATTEVYIPPMMLVPAGDYLVGNPNRRDGESRSLARGTVNLQGFHIACHEVTIEEFYRFLASPAGQTVLQRRRPSEYPFKWGSRDAENEHVLRMPATWITWSEAVAYCEWLTTCANASRREGDPEVIFDLPREEEWEAAMLMEEMLRPRTGRASPTGKNRPHHRSNPFDPRTIQERERVRGIPRTYPFVEARPSGSGMTEGLLHMLGNAREWCHGKADESSPVLRGGGYDDDERELDRYFRRIMVDPEKMERLNGFRLVRRERFPSVSD